jgi:2-dehydro-3-deoxyphosphogalactonate aldolase
MELRAALTQCPIAAILRGVKPDEIDAIGDALIEAGVAIIEVPLNSPQPFESIKQLAARHGHHALVGAGHGVGGRRRRTREGRERAPDRRTEFRC